MLFSFLNSLKTIFFSCLIIINMIGSAFAISGEEIKNLTTRFLKEQGYNSNPLIKNNRKFSQCSHNLKIKGIFKDFKTVSVSCTSPLKWKILLRTNAVPLRSQENNIFKNNSSKEFQNAVLVLSSSLKKGEAIKNDDISLKVINKNIGNGFFIDPKNLIGRKLRQNLSLGQIVRSRHLEENWMIQKGQLVTISSKLNGVNVSMEGKSLENGHFQQLIKVTNLSSGKVIQGRIINQKNILIK